MIDRTEAQKIYQAAVRCTGEGGNVRGLADVLKAAGRTAADFRRDTAAVKAKIESGEMAPRTIEAVPPPCTLANQAEP